jgi:phenylpropionate dioxygenase-like ring-hydroxylating dioxygenase large terminal subunit
MLKPEELLQASAFEPTLVDAADAISLPREAYISEDFYQFELDTLWRRSWVCVGHSTQIPNPGDFVPLTLAGDPLIMVRGRDGRINVMSSVCRHRAMVITGDEPGNCDRFTCNYHGWQYGLDGSLIGAPFMRQTNAFDRSSQRLPALAVEIWRGFVFVNYLDDPEPLGPQMADYDEVLGNWDIENLSAGGTPASQDFEFNWKIFLENAAECYHCDFLHPSWHGCAPTRNTQPEIFPDHPAALVCTVETTHQDASFIPPDFKALFPPLPKLTEAERNIMHFQIVMPNLLVAHYPDGVMFGILTPSGTKKTRITFGSLFPESTIASPTFAEAFTHSQEVTAPELAEDFEACAKVHEGLESTLATRGRLSGQLEQTVNHFHRWILKHYLSERQQ